MIPISQEQNQKSVNDWNCINKLLHSKEQSIDQRSNIQNEGKLCSYSFDTNNTQNLKELKILIPKGQVVQSKYGQMDRHC